MSLLNWAKKEVELAKIIEAKDLKMEEYTLRYLKEGGEK